MAGISPTGRRRGLKRDAIEQPGECLHKLDEQHERKQSVDPKLNDKDGIRDPAARGTSN